MPMNETQISSIEASIKALIATGNPLVPGLRSMFPDVTFVRCCAGEVDATPYRTCSKYELFLFNCSQVCIQLTDRLESADGVIVAEVNCNG